METLPVTGYARYDYAWKTPGWTTQDPVIPAQTDGYVDPGMPDDVTMVRLYGTFMELDTGRPLEGVLRLRVNETVTHLPSGSLIPAGAIGGRPIRFTKGVLETWLPATDDPQLSPAFEYVARLTVRGDVYDFTFSLPAAEPDVNIVSKMPVS
jgi:hypothetical protein